MQQTLKSPVEALQWRYATKRFDPNKKLSPETWAQLRDAVVLSPSSYGMQPWRFVVVTDPAKKQQLVEACYGQTQPAECSHFVIFCRNTKLDTAFVDKYLARVREVRGGTEESQKGFRDLLHNFVNNMSPERAESWMARQCYIALGVLMTSAALLQVDNCPMEGIEQAKVDALLDLPAKGCTSLVACALGYRSSEDKYAQMQKVRFEPSRVVIEI
jgi:nitroreductase